jgi:hypothetical protein
VSSWVLRLARISGEALSNVFEQKLAPTIVKAAEAVVPKLNCSTETVRNKCSRVLDRLSACGTLRAFRHSLKHRTSFRTLKLSELGGGWELRDGSKQFECRIVNKKPRWWYAADRVVGASEDLRVGIKWLQCVTGSISRLASPDYDTTTLFVL